VPAQAAEGRPVDRPIDKVREEAEEEAREMAKGAAGPWRKVINA